MWIKEITNYNNIKSLGSRLRKKRIQLLLLMINDVYRTDGYVRIIDIGGTRTYWNIVPENLFKKKNIHITIANLPGTERPYDQEHFTFVEADGCRLEKYKDKSFHIAHSNSVIEHVGEWEKIVQFSKELKRVAQRYFIQTPNYWFPIEPHCLTPFFHWLPKPFQVWLVLNFNLGHWRKKETVDSAVRIVESIHLLNKRMFRELFKEADIHTEWLLFPKSFIAIK